MVKLISGIPAVGFADAAKVFIFRGTFYTGIQVQLDKALHILAEFPALVIDVSVNR
jgi:hypothetical protein